VGLIPFVQRIAEHHLDLFRIRAFSAGNLTSLLSGLGRGLVSQTTATGTVQ
jgi:hypothetical protein